MNPAPVQTGPALSDPTTALMVDRAVASRRWTLLMAGLVPCVALTVWVRLVDEAVDLWVVLLAVAHFSCSSAYFIGKWWSLRWTRDRERLAYQPWRPVGAVVLRRATRWGPTVLDLVETGSRWTARARLRPGHEEVVVRTGRAWITTGPRAALLRVDGSHQVFGCAPSDPVVAARVEAVDADPFTPALLEGRAMRRGSALLVAVMAAWAMAHAHA